ncbi:hypothetical protein [Streptomyces sp. NPDC001450]
MHDLFTSPRCSPLLFGYAGSPAADLGGLVQRGRPPAAPALKGRALHGPLAV